MEDKEWLTLEEMAKAANYCKNTLDKRARHGRLPEGTTRWEDHKRLYHRSLIPILVQNKKNWLNHQMDLPPDDAVPYDGYLLKPDEIARLELVRRRNGYRTMHWTTKSLTELIAMGGDRQNNYDYY